MKRTAKFKPTFIRQWRDYRGLTLEQLGGKVDLTPSYLSMLERGQRGYAQETLELIAHHLQTDAGSLIQVNPEETNQIWSIWHKADISERQQIEEVAKIITKNRVKP